MLRAPNATSVVDEAAVHRTNWIGVLPTISFSWGTESSSSGASLSPTPVLHMAEDLVRLALCKLGLPGTPRNAWELQSQMARA